MSAIPPDLKQWLDVIQWVMTAGMAFVLWLRKPGEEAGSKVDDLADEIAAGIRTLSERVTVLEEHVKHVPTTTELTELEGTVKEQNARLSALQEAMTGMRTQLNRIEAYLLQAKDSRL